MKSSECTSNRLAVEIKECARTLGFDLVGITGAQPPQHSKEFQQWLAADFHGEMAYMAKNAEKRVQPANVLPEARSIVVVGMNYNAESPRGGTRPTTADGRKPTPAPPMEGTRRKAEFILRSESISTCHHPKRRRTTIWQLIHQ